VICDDCIILCANCHHVVCSICIPKCIRNNSYCWCCHIQTCGLCWDFEKFKFLIQSVKQIIVTTLLCWYRKKQNICVPVKYIKLKIFRYLIHMSNYCLPDQN